MLRYLFGGSNFTNYTCASVRSRVSPAGVVAWALVVTCTACSSPVIKQYQKDGVQFSYFSNWKIVKDAPVDGTDIRSIQIEGPSHAVISLIFEPPGSRQSLAQFADAVASRRGAAIEARLSIGGVQTAEVSKGTSSAIADTVAGQRREGVLQEFSINLLGQQVPHQARFYLVEGTKHRIMVMAQVATSHATETRGGSDLILNTLVIEDGG